MQILDLYLPEKKWQRSCPVIIHTHGGAFANGDQRENNLEPVLKGLDRGYAVASVQYRRSREALFLAQLYDAKAVIRWLRANAERFHLDIERFAAWGPSSGGWLASMIGVTGGNPAFEDFPQGNGEFRSDVQAVIDWCGSCGNFLLMDEELKKRGFGMADYNAETSQESRFMGLALPEYRNW